MHTGVSPDHHRTIPPAIPGTHQAGESGDKGGRLAVAVMVGWLVNRGFLTSATDQGSQVVKKLHLGVASPVSPPSPLHIPSISPRFEAGEMEGVRWEYGGTGPAGSPVCHLGTNLPKQAFVGNGDCPGAGFGYNGRRMFKALIGPLIEWYQGALATGGYWLVGLLMAIESSILPLPSEVVIPPAAHLAYTRTRFR